MSKTLYSSVQCDLFPDTIDETSIGNKIYKAKSQILVDSFGVIDNTQKCPNCGSDFLEKDGCFNCGNGTLSGEFIIGDDYNLEDFRVFGEEEKENKKNNNNSKLIKLDKYLFGEEVIYTKQHNKLKQNGDNIFLRIGEKKFKISFEYKIAEIKDLTDLDSELSKVGENLLINGIYLHNGRTYVKKFIKSKKDFLDLSNFILHEIINNKLINHSLD